MNHFDLQSSLQKIASDFSSDWDIKVHALCNILHSQLWKTYAPNVQGFVHALTEDDITQASYDQYIIKLIEEIQRTKNVHTELRKHLIAYVSLEFGISQSMHQYAGGLGILAGDHVKTAHDTGIPIIGIGLFYAKGSPHQLVNALGIQEDIWVDESRHQMSLIKDEYDHPLTITVDFPEGTAHVQLYKVIIGNNCLILLDTMHEQNDEHPALKEITNALYFGDRSHRLKQEILIGIGGIKALHAIGADVSFLHINEGHCAFAMTEWILRRMNELNMSFDDAVSVLSTRILFTTHTPVDAGNEVFSRTLIIHECKHHIRALGLTEDQFMELGYSSSLSNKEFSMSAMAIKLAGSTNAVSQLHGSIARTMWQHLDDQGKKKGSSIISVTNGIHTPTWIGPSIAALLDEQIGNSWRTSPHDPTSWYGVKEIAHTLIESAHSIQKQSMIDYLKRRITQQYWNETSTKEAFYIGYARRFALYKRPLLLFNNGERLRSIIKHSQIPIRILLAGKAHPDDVAAKELIAKVHELIALYELQDSIFFVEDYDIELARAMVQGCDLWLNTPQRPMEASGTSGMKAAVNGCLHCSILDGWWDEGYGEQRGFKIQHVEDIANETLKDQREADSLYSTLEQTIIPLFAGSISYHGLSWSDMMLHSIAELGPQFSAARMMHEYQYQLYQSRINQ